jgi:hypothetical protein
MRPARLMVMIIVGLSLLVCCCALPRCDGRWRRGWDWGYTPVEAPEAEAGQPYGVAPPELPAQAQEITVSSP